MNRPNSNESNKKKHRFLNEHKTVILDKKDDYLSQEIIYDISVKKLVIEGGFNKQIISFPIALHELIIQGSYNQDLPEFPKTLKKLVIGGMFNKDLRLLPESLIFLTLKGRFNKEISHLPPNLTLLQIAGSFNKILPELPESLLELNINRNAISFNSALPTLPNNLKILKLESPFFEYPITRLPASLKVLIISGVYDHILPNLPINLEKLHLIGNYSHKINYLPDSLQELYLGSSYKVALPQLPKSLVKLSMTISKYYDYNLPYPSWFEFDIYSNFPFAKLETHKFLDFHNSLIEIKTHMKNSVTMKNLLDAHFLTYDYKKNYITFTVSEKEIITTNEYIEGVSISLSYYDFIVNNVNIDKMIIDVNKPFDYFPKTLKDLEFKITYTYNLPKLPNSLSKLNVSKVSKNVVNKLKIPESLQNYVTPKVKLSNVKKLKSLKLSAGDMKSLFRNEFSEGFFQNQNNLYL